jgi:PAS domain S-box-containing protein
LRDQDNMTLSAKAAAAPAEAIFAPPLRMSLMKEISERIRRPFLTGMAILLIAGVGSYIALQRYRLTSLQVAYSDEVMVQLNDLLANLDHAEAIERAYLTSGDPAGGKDPALIAAIELNLARLQRAASTGEVPASDFPGLAAQVHARLNFFDQLSDVRVHQGEAAATAMFTAGPPNGTAIAIHDRVREMNAAQERQLAARLVSEHLFSRLLGVIVVAGCILAFASITYAGYFVDGALKLITTHLTEDARGREALSALNQTLEQRINERSAAAAQCARDLERVGREAHQQEQLLKALMDFIAEGVLVCDTHMRLLRTNAAAERLLGKDLGQQTLDRLPEAFEMIDSASGDPIEGGQWPLALAVRGNPQRLDFRLRDLQSGEMRQVESLCMPLRDEQGVVRAALGLVRDVTPTARGQQAAALLEAIAALSDDALITLTRDGKVSSWNPGAARMFGYAAEEIIGHASRRIVSDEARAVTREVSRRMLEGGASERFEMEAVRKDGSRLPLIIEAFALRHAFDQDAAFMLICRDLTDRKLLEAEASRARAEALEAARMRFEFLINMSREFRNALNRITRVVPQLLESSLAAAQRDHVRMISSNTEGLLQTVNDILDLASLASGKVEFEQSEFDLYEVVEGAIDVAAERGQSKDLELVLAMGPDLPRRLIGDRHRMAQVLAILVDSSIKFNDHGEVVVSVDCEQRGDGFTALRCELRGTGAAAPADLQARLSQPLLAADARADREPGGNGLGLAIAAQLVERMGGGKIVAAGEPGHSLVVRFVLRFQHVPGEARDAGERVEMAGRRILVVDDNATSRVGVCGQLAQLGLSPDSAIGGAEALVVMRQRAAASTPYDLVLIDMRMPGMDGFALVRAIRSDPRLNAARLVMMGPYGVPEQPDTDGWLIKPIKPTRLLECLKRLAAGPGSAPPQLDRASHEAAGTVAANGHTGALPNGSNGLGHGPPVAANGHPSLDRSVLGALRALGGGKGDAIVQSLIKSFTAELPARITELDQAALAPDGPALRTHAMMLQGLAAGLGLTRLGALCAALAAHTGQADPRAVAAIIDSLRDEAAKVIALLEDEAAEPAGGPAIQA